MYVWMGKINVKSLVMLNDYGKIILSWRENYYILHPNDSTLKKSYLLFSFTIFLIFFLKSYVLSLKGGNRKKNLKQNKNVIGVQKRSCFYYER